jgi:hypothetical protein
LLQRESRLHSARTLNASATRAQIVDHLRSVGDYGRLSERAKCKREHLRSQGLDNPSLSASGIPQERLVQWFFVERQGRRVPEDLDIYAQAQGFDDRLTRALGLKTSGHAGADKPIDAALTVWQDVQGLGHVQGLGTLGE